MPQKRVERAAANAAMIKQAIRDRRCLAGTHMSLRVRFAPHALGSDEQGKQTVIALEYRGMTTGRPNWVGFVVDRLHGLQRVSDPWRSGSRESTRHFRLTEIEAAVDDRWGTPKTLEGTGPTFAVRRRAKEPFPAPTRSLLGPNRTGLQSASENSSLIAGSPGYRHDGKFPK